MEESEHWAGTPKTAFFLSLYVSQPGCSLNNLENIWWAGLSLKGVIILSCIQNEGAFS